ncbi:unnamed protein product [Blepharisma stoltei]|uniref:SCD domain-containing protein n=1 Tax=Blepharisma stoltei TaxID=1481888 RepID=A0AAU9JDK5_9CILI|nr:unnamed protein product [Blepharisma stoltei]
MSLNSRKKRDQGLESNSSSTKDYFDPLHNEILDPRALILDWLHLYSTHEKEALASFLSLILQSCGLSKNLVTLDDLEESDMENLLSKIQEDSKDCDEYPLISKNKGFKNYSSLYHRVYFHLIREAGDKIYDGIMLNFLINWLSSLTFMTMRPIRHTATFGIVNLGNSLLDLLVNEVNDKEKLKVLKQNEAKSGNNQKLEELKEHEIQLDTKIKKLIEMLDSIRKEVIGFRCKDIMPEIRILSSQCISYWAEKYPSKYLNNDTFKCMGMMLYDKSPEVREAVIRLINKICTWEIDPKFIGLIIKLKPRIIAMCYDIENKCCIEAIEACKKLNEIIKFSDEDKDVISRLIWTENEEIRDATCDFIISAVFNDSLPKETMATGFGLDQGKYIDAEKAILLLVNFFIKYSNGQIYLIDPFVKAFWSKTSAIRSWEAMTNLLSLGDSSRPGTAELHNDQKMVIINFLISSLKNLQNLSEQKPKNSMVNLSTILISHLPQLFTYFRANQIISNELAKLTNYLDLSALASKDLKAPFNQLISALTDLHLQSDNIETLMKTGQSLSKFAKEPHPLQKDSRTELTKLTDYCCEELKKEFKKFTLEGEEGVLEVWLKRIEGLISHKDILEELTKERFEDFTYVISQYLSDSINNSGITLSCARILYSWNLWYLHEVVEKTELVDDYIEKRNNIIELFTALVAKADCQFELRKEAFKLLCETIMVISGKNSKGSLVHYEVGEDVWGTIEEYMSEIPIDTENDAKMISNPNATVLNIKNSSDADSTSQLVCIHIARIICTCPSITNSHLPSSFFANFGISTLKTINIIVKHVLNFFKFAENKPESNDNVLFTIMLESLIKCMGNGTDEDINAMKELAKKFVTSIGVGPLKSKQADKFVLFLLDGIKFALNDKENFPILEALSMFIGKNYISQSQMKDLYEKISKDSDKIIEVLKTGENNAETYPLEKFVYLLSKQVGLSRTAPIEPSENDKMVIEKTKKTSKMKTPPKSTAKKSKEKPAQSEKKKTSQEEDKLNKTNKKEEPSSSQRPRRAAKDKAKLISEKKSKKKEDNKKRKERSPIEDEEEPVARTRKAALRRK